MDANGQITSGWNMRNVHLPSRVAEAHSETALQGRIRALDFMQRRGSQPWVLHLSVGPHWPYMPRPLYHQRYR